jgi:hypothetical protein
VVIADCLSCGYVGKAFCVSMLNKNEIWLEKRTRNMLIFFISMYIYTYMYSYMFVLHFIESAYFVVIKR